MMNRNNCLKIRGGGIGLSDLCRNLISSVLRGGVFYLVRLRTKRPWMRGSIRQERPMTRLVRTYGPEPISSMPTVCLSLIQEQSI